MRVNLYCLEDGTADLIISDDKGEGFSEPYTREQVTEALVMITKRLGDYIKNICHMGFDAAVSQTRQDFPDFPEGCVVYE